MAAPQMECKLHEWFHMETRQRVFVTDIHQRSGMDRALRRPRRPRPRRAGPCSPTSPAASQGLAAVETPHPRPHPARTRDTAFTLLASAAPHEKDDRNLSTTEPEAKSPIQHPHANWRRRPLTSDAVSTRDPGYGSRSASPQPIRDPLRAAPPTADKLAPTRPDPAPACQPLASDWLEPAVGGTSRSRPDGSRGRGSEAS